MPKLRVESFAGLAPKFDRRQLPLGAAQIAENCRFDSGDLKGYFSLGSAPGSGLVGNAGANLGSLFYYRVGDQSRHIGFGENLVVSANRSVIPNDAHDRFYWCIKGEGLRAISLVDADSPTPGGSATGSGSDFRPFTGYQLGVPAPKLRPTAAVVLGDLESVGFGTDTAIDSISRTNPVTINLAGGHDFEAGQTVTISIDPSLPRPTDPEGGGTAPPPESGGGSTAGQVWTLDGLSGTVANVTANSFEIQGISTTNLYEFEAADLAAVTVTRTLEDSELEDRVYVFTYVTEFGEEGPPSEASNIVSVSQDTGVQVEISDDAHVRATDGGSRARVTEIRVYRSVSGQTTQLRLVGTLPFAGGASDDSDLEWLDAPSTSNPEIAWSATLNDRVDTVALQDFIESTGYFPPPNDLDGICQFSNGIMVGWRRNTLYYSEPYLPHAWDPDNTDALLDDIVGCEAVGGMLVVGTRGRPYIAEGVDSSSMRSRRLDIHAPLFGQRLICDAGSGVIYVADNGLLLISRGGTQWLTEARFTKEDWLSAVQAYDRAVYHDRRVILYKPDTDPLIFTMDAGSVEASNLDIQFAAAAVTDTHLAVVVRQTAPGNPHRLMRYFNEGATRLTARWRSGIIKVTRPVNWAVAQVLADDYPVTFRMRHIDPSSYNDPVVGQPTLEPLDQREFTVVGPEPFWLPSDYLSREFELELESPYRVQELALATSMEELRAT